jgi:hypothetical protein
VGSNALDVWKLNAASCEARYTAVDCISSKEQGNVKQTERACIAAQREGWQAGLQEGSCCSVGEVAHGHVYKHSLLLVAHHSKDSSTTVLAVP